MRRIEARGIGVVGSMVLLVTVGFLLPTSSALGGSLRPAAAPSAVKIHAWTQLTYTSGTPPSARESFGMAYDPDLKAAVLFGGIDASGRPLSDTWLYSHGHWKNVTATSGTGPAARWYPGLVFDPQLNGTLLFGGQNYYTSICGASCAFNDTWLFNSTGWHNISSALAPPPQAGPGLVYDTHDGYVVLYGRPAAAGGYSDFWVYNGGKWTNVTAKITGAAIPSLAFTTIVDDAAAGYVVLYGGTAGCSGAGITYDLRNLQLHNLSAYPPDARMGSRAAAYDAALKGVVLTGGYDANCNVVPATWMFKGGHWQNITAFTGTAIPGRWDGRMVWDSALGTHGADLVFGGDEYPTGGYGSLGSDTWKLAP
ncbi:MAG: hypothetical protein L3K09_00945 [Thermoplasmata archaeon]|nr:hypothetical protein [Thermoplasmata archaeon]